MVGALVLPLNSFCGEKKTFKVFRCLYSQRLCRPVLLQDWRILALIVLGVGGLLIKISCLKIGIGAGEFVKFGDIITL